MRMMSLAAMSAALLITPALAAQGTSPGSATSASAAAQSTKPAKAEKKICKRLPASGTRLEERVCMTKSEWKMVEEEAR